MPEPFTMEIKGLDRLLKALHKFPKEVEQDLGQAGQMSADEVLATKGLRNYADPTAANMPPPPYYKRGTGYMRAGGGTSGGSENLGKRWYVQQSGYQTRIGNSASYAQYVHGDDTQAKAMGRIGWKKLYATFKDKRASVTKIYNQMVGRTIKRLGL